MCCEAHFVLFLIKGPCPSEKIGSPEAYGVFNWPQTSVGSHSRLACPYNHRSFARRECLYATETKIKSVWGPIVLTKCDYREKRSKEIFLLVQVFNKRFLLSISTNEFRTLHVELNVDPSIASRGRAMAG